MIRCAILVVATLAAAGAAGAAAPDRAPTPPARPGLLTETPAAPDRADRGGGGLGALFRSLRPNGRPETPRTATRTPSGGGLCGDPALAGAPAAAIPGRLRGCGVADPVRVTHVSGVRLSQPATIHCDTARALRQWVDDSVKPAFGQAGGGVAGLRVAAHYVCRTRNNRPGARISEHGRGRAIDISAIHLRSGGEITVLSGWADRRWGSVLKQVHRGACGPFSTVIGPDGDRYHLDHLHLDTARRGGRWCR